MRKVASISHVARITQMGKLSFLAEKIGGWWDRDAEIDLLAISQTQKAALVGECKWSINPVGTNILEELKQKSQVLVKKYGIQKLQFALFARSGSTNALEEQAKLEGIELFTVDSLVKNQ